MKLFKRTTYWGIILLMVIWQILLTFQGLDLADTGFHLTAFRFIFDDPYSVQYSMMFWLSDVCGAMWMKLWPAGGLYWFRIGWAVLISGTFLLYLNMLRKVLNKQEALLGLAVTLVFILQGGPECLNYDIFTTFGYALGILLLFNGLTKNKPFLLFLSGIVFGTSFFFKLSNVTAIIFALLIVFSYFQDKDSFPNFLKKFFLWLLGTTAGVAMTLLLIKELGHWDLFTQNIDFLAQMGADSGSSHGIKPMLLSYLSGYLNAVVMVIIFAALAVIYSLLLQKFKATASGKYQNFQLALVSLVVVVLAIVFGEAFWSKIRYLFIGLMLIEGFLLISDKKQNREMKLLAVAGLLLVVVAPLGSDSGLAKSVWGMWVLGPLVLSRFFDQRQLKPVISEVRASFLQKALLFVIFFSAVIYAWQSTYFDVGSRSEKVYAVDHPGMKFIFASQKRAEVVNELVREAFPKMEKDEYLLSFIEIPMLNYLGDKKPFISTSWPKLYYNPETFEQKLEEALQKRQHLPAIIRQKQNATIHDWPTTPDRDYLSYPDELSKWPEHGKILNEFINQNNYQVVWENEMFQLLRTNKKIN
jgi:hypothetical protein